MKPQHIEFCDYFLECGNAAEAYKRAYPNCKTDLSARTRASKLLDRDDVQEYLNNLSTERSCERIAKADEVLEFLTASMRDTEVGPRDRIKAAELLGKRYRLFIDKIEASVEAVVVFEGEEELED